MCSKRTTTPVVSSLKSMSPDELLSLSCPALINSSLLLVTETFTDNEPEKNEMYVMREVLVQGSREKEK